MTPITKSQWKSIGQVILFIFGSAGLAVGVAFVSNDPTLVFLAPLINVLAVTIQKLLTSGEEAAVATLPTSVQAQAQQTITQVTATVEKTAVDAVTPKAQ